MNSHLAAIGATHSIWQGQVEPQQEVTIVFPLHDNNGASLALSREAAKARVLEIAGGYSAYLQNGAWLGEDGRKYEDTSERIVAVCSNDDLHTASYKVKQLRQLASNCAITMKQQAIFFQTRDVTVEFITQEDE